MSKFNAELSVDSEEMKRKYAEITQSDEEETRAIRVRELREHYDARLGLLCVKYFNANKNNVLGAYLLWQWSGVLEPDRLDELYAQGGEIVRQFTPLQLIIDKNKIARQTAEGMIFTDFTIENGKTDGSKVSLSDYVGKGKYVLVDFWASWCGPCLAELPTLIEVYNKYKGDKFELLGIAVWEDREATQKYLEDHNTAWPQIIEANKIPTDLYGIQGIPHIILFGPDGTIVARNLRGDGLKAKVAEMMQ
jgi:thiol-disulfide isomerase/thioredoxin